MYGEATPVVNVHDVHEQAVAGRQATAPPCPRPVGSYLAPPDPRTPGAVERAMGFFDFFLGGDEKQIQRHAKRAKSPNAQAEERELSMQWLAENGTEEAVYGILGRFTLTYEQRMKDTAEKELAHRLLLGLGKEKVGNPVRQWVRKNESFAVPLQIIDTLEGPAAAVDVLLDLLGREVDPFKPEKKRQVLIKLADFLDERIVQRVPACLEDFDEGVRYAAIETLLAQESDAVRADLARALARRDEESNRVRVRIAEAFNRRGWTLGDLAAGVSERPPVGWRVEGERVVPA